jgi:hypothetical protein
MWRMTDLQTKDSFSSEKFLDEDCLGSKGEIYQKDLEISFKYEFLAPDPQVQFFYSMRKARGFAYQLELCAVVANHYRALVCTCATRTGN